VWTCVCVCVCVCVCDGGGWGDILGRTRERGGAFNIEMLVVHDDAAVCVPVIVPVYVRVHAHGRANVTARAGAHLCKCATCLCLRYAKTALSESEQIRASHRGIVRSVQLWINHSDQEGATRTPLTPILSAARRTHSARPGALPTHILRVQPSTPILARQPKGAVKEGLRPHQQETVLGKLHAACAHTDAALCTKYLSSASRTAQELCARARARARACVRACVRVRACDTRHSIPVAHCIHSTVRIIAHRTTHCTQRVLHI
jgi:hypothetical protein